jgi:hypothetical protein
MRRGHLLLQLFLGILVAHELAPSALDPWRGWLAFKEFARRTAEYPDPGVSVQFIAGGADGPEPSLIFLRQEVERDGDRLEPVSGVVCELRFASDTLNRGAKQAGHSSRWTTPRWATPRPGVRPSRPRAWAVWSFDFPTFERFVDAVEQEPEFQDLVVQRPLRSEVSYEEV